MRALASDGSGGFAASEVAEPAPAPGDVLVRVHAASVGPRDWRMARSRPGYRGGSDFAGVVERAGRRAGVRAGDRVVGVIPGGAWAEAIAVPADSLCVLPGEIPFEAAAATASSGLTALYALERTDRLVGGKVLVTGAGGAVGSLACQIAAVAGAGPTGWIRSGPARANLASLGVRTVDASEVAGSGPFDLILDLIGGETLTQAIRLVRPGGRIVVIGSESGELSSLDAAMFYQNFLAIEGFALFPELARKPARDGLARLFALAAEHRLRPPRHSLQPAMDGLVQRQQPGGSGRTVLTFDT